MVKNVMLVSSFPELFTNIHNGQKLPTTFTKLDLSGFDLENEKQKHTG
jgi:hypothetical protein